MVWHITIFEKFCNSIPGEIRSYYILKVNLSRIKKILSFISGYFYYFDHCRNFLFTQSHKYLAHCQIIMNKDSIDKFLWSTVHNYQEIQLPKIYSYLSFEDKFVIAEITKLSTCFSYLKIRILIIFKEANFTFNNTHI